MPFIKNDPNINVLGRPKGSKNKLYATKRYIFNLLEDNRDKLINELKSLKGEKFVNYYIKLMEYVMAKRHNQIIDIKKLSNKEINEMLDQIN